MLFDLDFANNTILLCFFFFFLIIELCSLIPAEFAQIFNPIVELVITIGIPNKKAKEKIEIHPVIAEAKIGKCSIQFRIIQPFFMLSTREFIVLYFLKEIISCFIYIF